MRNKQVCRISSGRFYFTLDGRKIRMKNLMKIAMVIICLGLLGGVLIFAVNAYVRSDTSASIISEDEAKETKADCILVLGAGLKDDGTPNLMLKDRLDTAISLYNNGKVNRIIVSGDHGQKEYDEANAMKDYVVSAGVASEHVFMDHAGFSTYDSIYRARDIFKAEKIIIVTQKYHLYRSLYIAKSLGLEAYGLSAPGEEYYGQGYRDFRESVAVFKDFFKTIIKPKPTYLGEAIPVWGNGNLTNDK